MHTNGTIAVFCPRIVCMRFQPLSNNSIWLIGNRLIQEATGDFNAFQIEMIKSKSFVMLVFDKAPDNYIIVLQKTYLFRLQYRRIFLPDNHRSP